MSIQIKENKANVVLISAERFPSFGPISIASMLSNNSISVSVLQCIVGFFNDQIEKLVDLYISDENQIIAVSTTFSRDSGQINAIKHFLDRARATFPNIKIIVGGANDDLYWVTQYQNITVLAGQNRETEILNWFIENTSDDPKNTSFVPFSFVNSKIQWRQFFSNNPPKGFTGFLEISRSCIFNCSFCAYQNRGMKLSYKNVDIIKQEFNEFFEIFNTPILYMTCNTFNDDEEKIAQINEIFEALCFTPEIFAYTRLDLFSKQSKLTKDFYTKYVRFPFFGIESLNSNTLKNIKKGNNVEMLKNAMNDFRQIVPDAFITASIIIGLPFDKFDDYSHAVKFLSTCVDFINISALRLNQYKGQDKYSFSQIELTPEEFGYSILPLGQRTNSISSDEITEFNMNENSFSRFPGWVRSDGYDFENAILDSIKLEQQTKLPISFGPHIFLRARGVSRERLARATGMITQHRMFVDYSYANKHPAIGILEQETFNFYQELFQYYIKPEQIKIHEKII
jgi:hypothetical protein